MLTLPIKKHWFDMILSGDKKEEYREIKPYYTKRFINLLAPYWKDFENDGEKFFLEECRAGWYEADIFEVTFRNGYSANAPHCKANVCLTIGEGKTEWGAEEGKEYYILNIKDIRES